MSSERGNRRTGRMVLVGYRMGVEISGEPGKRLRELENKARLSGEEFAEMRRLYETYSSAVFLEGPEFTKLGVTDPQAFIENTIFCERRAERAYQGAFFMEAISLRMLLLDFILRTFIVHKSKAAIKPFSTEDKRSFGQVINEAKKCGLPEELEADLWAFNKKRVDAIHHFVLGRTTYQEIGDAYRAADNLFERIIWAMSLPPMEDP